MIVKKLKIMFLVNLINFILVTTLFLDQRGISISPSKTNSSHGSEACKYSHQQ